MFEAHSALAQVLPQTGRDGADGRRALQLGEVPVGSLVQLGFYPGHTQDESRRIGELVAAVLGGPLPQSAVEAASFPGTSGPHTVFRIARDQILVRTPDADLARRLRAGVPAELASVTALDGGRTGIAIAGPAARALLARLVAIDLHPAVFAVGHFAQTPIHHVGGLLQRTAPERYEFLALRTYARDTWEVIEDAARVFGYEVLNP